MNVRNAFLAEAATAGVDGGIHVFGMFDRLVAPAYPVGIQRLVVVLRTDLETSDLGANVPFEIRLLGPDGNIEERASGELDFADRKSLYGQDWIIHLVDLELSKAGNYSIEVSVREHVVATLSLQALVED